MLPKTRLSGKKTLITGASGFIGSHLSRRLFEQGAEIHGISRKKQINEESKIKWWQGDLTNYETVRNLLKTIEPEIIFHLASYVKGGRDLSNLLPTFHCNLASQIYLMTAASEVGCTRIISAGSMEEPLKADPQYIPSSPYAAAKWTASAYGRMFNALYQLPIINLRIFMVYGPAQRDISKLIPYVILSLLKGKSPKLSSGSRMVDWIYVEDVIDAMIAVSLAPDIEGTTVDVGSGSLVSIRSIVQRLVNQINQNIKPQFGAILDRPMEQEPVARLADTYAKIGWSPKVPLEKGLELTVNWYKSNLEVIESNYL